MEDIYASYDKRIVKVNKKTSKKTVLVESIKKALPGLNQKVNLSLELAGYDENNRLILKEIFVAENKQGNTHYYDLGSNKFSLP